MMPSIMSGSLIRAMPPCTRMSAGTRSSAITATAPASSAILACSGVTTSMITPPLSISAMPRFTRAVPVSGKSRIRWFRTGAAADTVEPQDVDVDRSATVQNAPARRGVDGYLHRMWPRRVTRARPARANWHQCRRARGVAGSRVMSDGASVAAEGVVDVEELGLLRRCRTGAARGPAGGGGRRGCGRPGRCRTCGRGRPGARRPLHLVDELVAPSGSPSGCRLRPRWPPAGAGTSSPGVPSRVARSARVRSDSARPRSAGSACRARRTASAAAGWWPGRSSRRRRDRPRPRTAPTRARSSAVRADSTRLCSRSRRLARQETQNPKSTRTRTASTTMVQVTTASLLAVITRGVGWIFAG